LVSISKIEALNYKELEVQRALGFDLDETKPIHSKSFNRNDPLTFSINDSDF